MEVDGCDTDSCSCAREIQDLKAELAMHDQFASRSAVNYGDYSESQREQVRDFPCSSLRCGRMEGRLLADHTNHRDEGRWRCRQRETGRRIAENAGGALLRSVSHHAPSPQLRAQVLRYYASGEPLSSFDPLELTSLRHVKEILIQCKLIHQEQCGGQQLRQAASVGAAQARSTSSGLVGTNRSQAFHATARQPKPPRQAGFCRLKRPSLPEHPTEACCHHSPPAPIPNGPACFTRTAFLLPNLLHRDSPCSLDGLPHASQWAACPDSALNRRGAAAGQAREHLAYFGPSCSSWDSDGMSPPSGDAVDCVGDLEEDPRMMAIPAAPDDDFLPSPDPPEIAVVRTAIPASGSQEPSAGGMRPERRPPVSR